MLEHLDLSKILFLDVECVSGKANYDELNEDFQYLWKLKSKSVLRKYDEEITDEEASAAYKDKAGIYAEFGKIICISVGVVGRHPDTKELFVRLKSFASENETDLLKDFSQMVQQYYNNTSTHFFCGHNIREFDIPYICRRMLINQLPLPNSLNLAGKKPWETKHLLDTLELWKFGDYKNYTSLKLLAAVFGFPSPKDDIDGSEVGRVFWEENDLPRIATYCEKDVLATVQLLLKYMRMPLLESGQVIHV
ncbi:MAG: 3'-5' exonuclease [Bacteroidota bacterium]